MSDRYGSINTCHGKRKLSKTKKFLKKLLTNESGRDKISELPLRTKRQRNKLIFDK